MKKPVTIQVNASGKGLGAALIQDDCPVAFTSKVGTPTEQCYASNERELLTCVFGAECFWTYVFSRHFMIESDHKSLEQNLHEQSGRCPSKSTEDVTLTSGVTWSITQVSPRRGNGYSRHLTEILTWGYTRDSPRHLCQWCIHWCWEEMRLPTHNQGWPTAKCRCRHNHHWMARRYQGCSKALLPYHGQCDSLAVEDGLVLCGEAIIVPPGERKKVLEQIYQGHLGTSKCQYRARQCAYWLGINKDIEQQVEACATHQRHWPQEPRQPLKPTPLPEWPWQ